MHITLHLTTACNQCCTYCYSSPPSCGMDMTTQVIDQAINFATQIGDPNIGLIFFGGEPLLRKDLITYALHRSRELEASNNSSFRFHYKVTTNGLELDEDFLIQAHKYKLQIGLSIDGTKKAHDEGRKTRSGVSSFDIIQAKLPMLLHYQPYAYAFQTVTPQNVRYYHQSVEYLLQSGFRYIISSLDYSGLWTDELLSVLKKQYTKIAKLYKELTLKEKKFFFSPFETKLMSHIRGGDSCINQCDLSRKQISVAPDGRIYPCVQFVRNGQNLDYHIGDIWNGFSDNRENLYSLSKYENQSCSQCALKQRCYNSCSCLNWQTTGTLHEVSPVLCASEQILISVADKLGAELYKLRAPMFIQKHYNVVYPILSMLEDEAMR